MMTSYKIKTCSSEDEVHPVSNLQNPDLFRIWQTDGYVKKATVDITFPQATKISVIDIGNAGCAFVEIFVGKDVNKLDEFQVLVPINGLMSLQDSKNGTNRNRTRVFTADKFTDKLASETWSAMRIVCTQPFTDKYAIGLSYLYVNSRNQHVQKDNSQPDLNKSPVKTSKVESGGSGSGKQSQTDDISAKQRNSLLLENLKAGVKKGKTGPDGDDDNGDGEKDNVDDGDDLFTSKNRKHSLPDGLDDIDGDPHPKKKKYANTPQLIVKPNSGGGGSDSEGDENVGNKHKTNHNSNNNNNNSNSNDSSNNKSGAADEDEKANVKKANEKSGILKGVVFAISGIENPERGQLRDKAVSMGASYRRDWDDDCTHLICRFAYTPKYIEVESKGGIIVTAKWILDCFAQSKRLPITKKYTLSEDKPQLSDDSEKVGKKKAASASSVSTAPSKKKKGGKKGSDIDSDDDGAPNEYDMHDSFIDNDVVDAHADGDDDYVPDEDVVTDDEDFNELVREGKAFLKKQGGLQKRPRVDFDSDEDTNNAHSDSDRNALPKPKKQSKPTSHTPNNKNHHHNSTHNSTHHKKPASVPGKKPHPKPKEEDEDAHTSGTEEMAEADINDQLDFLHHANDSDDDGGGDAKNHKHTHSSTHQSADENLGNSYAVNALPDFLSSHEVFFSGVPKKNEQTLKRYIVAYNGKVAEYLGDKTNYIITGKPWDANFDAVKKMHPDIAFVKPDWVYACHQKQKRIDPAKFAITKA